MVFRLSHLESATYFTEKGFLYLDRDDSVEKIALEIDSEPISHRIDNKNLIYDSLDANSNRRSGKDRRTFKYTVYSPERRSGIDRRGIGWYRN